MADENKYMNKISILHERMEGILAERDKNFIKSKTISQEEHQKLLRWDWPQGIGVYGIWKCYEKTHDGQISDILEIMVCQKLCRRTAGEKRQYGCPFAVFGFPIRAD